MRALLLCKYNAWRALKSFYDCIIYFCVCYFLIKHSMQKNKPPTYVLRVVMTFAANFFVYRYSASTITTQVLKSALLSNFPECIKYSPLCLAGAELFFISHVYCPNWYIRQRHLKVPEASRRNTTIYYYEILFIKNVIKFFYSLLLKAVLFT